MGMAHERTARHLETAAARLLHFRDDCRVNQLCICQCCMASDHRGALPPPAHPQPLTCLLPALRFGDFAQDTIFKLENSRHARSDLSRMSNDDETRLRLLI